MKKFTVSCIGLGMRGDIYLSLLQEKKEQYEIVSLCDLNDTRLSYYANKFDVSKENCFNNDTEFFQKTRSDLLLICTQDRDHFQNVVDALNAGYKNILVEKPFVVTFKDLDFLSAFAKERNAHIYVCHVLRYAPAFQKIKEYLNEGRIGELKSIAAIERVGLVHYAHSYARGHYANKETSSPMIMAKCCHDLDLLVWYANSLCDSLSSIGSLTYFVKENQPDGASNRCFNCKYQETCHFSAEKMYQTYLNWARGYISDERPVTDDSIHRALMTNQFGRCVFDCGNDVVDNQIVMMKFKNGIEATLQMTAFTPFGGRRYNLYGTEGEICLDEQLGTLTCRNRKGELDEIKISQLITATQGHGGGDQGLIDSLYAMLSGDTSSMSSSLEYSVESHRMALFAEESRLEDGVKIKL